LLSFYDSQIWAIARLGQVAVILSEDFKAGGGTRRGVVRQPAGARI
jgi:predicted nucleic acid-binding protein